MLNDQAQLAQFGLHSEPSGNFLYRLLQSSGGCNYVVRAPMCAKVYFGPLIAGFGQACLCTPARVMVLFEAMAVVVCASPPAGTPPLPTGRQPRLPVSSAGRRGSGQEAWYHDREGSGNWIKFSSADESVARAVRKPDQSAVRLWSGRGTGFSEGAAVRSRSAFSIQVR